MLGVVTGRLHEAETLRPRHESTVRAPTPMSTLVNLVGVHPDRNDQDDLPGKPVEQPGPQENGQSECQQNLRTFEPVVPREVRGIVVVQDVRLRDQLAGDRPVLAAVRVLQPVEQPREKVCGDDTGHHVDEYHEFAPRRRGYVDTGRSKTAGVTVFEVSQCRGHNPAMDITVSRESQVPIREQLTAQVIFLIGSGQLKPGDTLPSVRELAHRLHVHRNTVGDAYADPELDGLLEKTPGKRLMVRARYVTDRAQPDLDAVINAAVQAARESGYTLQQLRRRVEERLRAEPPDHLLLVAEESGMRVVLGVELRQRLRVPIDWCTVQTLESDRDRAVGALVLSPPGLLPQVEALLPAERPAVRLVYSAADAHMERIRQLANPSLIAVVSVSRYFLQMARTVLAPALGGRHSLEECLMGKDEDNLPGAADLIVCDSVAYRLLRSTHKASLVIHHRLISSVCLDEIEAIMTESAIAHVS